MKLSKLFKRKAPPAPADTLGDLTQYYSTHDQDARFASQHGKVEYLTTMRYIERYLRPGMRVLEIGAYAAYALSDMAILTNGIRFGGWFCDELKQGLFTAETYVHKPKPGQAFQLLRREDVEALTAPLPAQRLHYVATDGAARLVRKSLARMTPKQFATFMEYHYFLCERPDMAGMTNHSLDILRKTEGA